MGLPKISKGKWDAFFLKALTFGQMSYDSKKLFFMNFLLCGLARTAVMMLSYKRLSKYFGHCCQQTVASTMISTSQLQQGIVLKRSIQLASRYTPWTSNCLVQALVAKFWCQHYAIPYMFYIGFQKNAAKPSGLGGHAWVTAGPVTLSGGDSFDTFSVLVSYTSQAI